MRAGQTVLMHCATGGVGGLLVQLARLAGARVIGTASASKQDAVRALGAEPLDYRTADLIAQVRALAPDGIDAVFDHVGGQSLHHSWQMLAHTGTLVAYGIVSIRDDYGSVWGPMLKTLGTVYRWNTLPNGRHAHFYNLWGGQRVRPRAFYREMRAAMAAVFALLAQGSIQAHIAQRMPLVRAAEALRLAESGTIAGKIVLIPDHTQQRPG